MKPCPFCTLPEIQQRKVAENDLAWAFPTNIPITPGHMLIAPKRCVARYEDMTPGEKAAVEELRVKIIGALKTLFKAEGFNIAWNDGKIAGQSVPHYHLHVVPRTPGDAGIYEFEPRKFLYRPGEREASPEDELREVAELVRNALV